MSELEKKEERNKRIGWITAVAVQLVLVVLFYFLVAWKAPNPPIPEYGIELGFTTSAGAPSSTSPPETTEEDTIDEEEIEETEQQPLEEVAESESEDQPEPEVETIVEVVAEEVESPIKVEESEPATVDEEPIPEVTENEAIEEQADQVSEETPLEKASEEKPVEEPIEEPDTREGQGEEEEDEPVIDQRAIYGSQGNSEGNSEGASLSLAGWVWDFKPKPDDTSDDTGKIVYRIVVDSDGYLVKIEVVTSTVSPAVERKYRQEVEKLTFSKTVDNNAAALSTGTITFIITSK